MNDHNVINTTINNNGKRLLSPNIFSVPGGESSEVFNKLLKTTCDAVESEDGLIETEAEIDNGDDEALLTQQLLYEENDQESHEVVNIVNIITNWKSTALYQQSLHKQNLLYYYIIDRDSKNNDVLTANNYDYIKSVETTVYSDPLPVEMENLNFSRCSSFSNLASFYNNNKLNLPYSIKKIIKVFINQKYEENVNLFSDTSQKEDDYKFHFVAPLFKALFRHNSDIKKEWGESTVSRTKVDGLLSLLDEEGGVVSLLTVVEVSGPWSVTDNNHFMKDKIKIAKNLKLILNYIYKLNFKGGKGIKKIKLYGVQVYQKHFYIYSLQSIHSKLYVYKEEMKFNYPTSPTYFRSQLSLFIRNMLQVKSLIESSAENVLSFLNDDLLANDSNNNEKFLSSLENSPQKNKNKQT